MQFTLKLVARKKAVDDVLPVSLKQDQQRASKIASRVGRHVESPWWLLKDPSHRREVSQTLLQFTSSCT